MHPSKHAVLLLFFIKLSTSENNLHHIVKRTLLFPQYTILQFTYGVTAPLILPKRSINLSLCLQCNFELPFNSSQLRMQSVMLAKSAEDYDLERGTFYASIIAVLDGIGLTGRQCLLRTICEVAEIPMHIEESNSLLESIVHYLLTPSEDYTQPINYLQNATYDYDDDFLQAESIGRIRGRCHEEFPECSLSLVNLFTKLYRA